MKMIFKLFIYLIVFLMSLLILAPKELAYNFAEKELAKKQIIISDETRDERVFGLDIKDLKLYFEGIEVANTSKTSITTFLVYTKLKVKDVNLLDSFKSMIPSPIMDIELKHSVLEFDKVDIKASGLFGKVEGKADLLNRKVLLELFPSKVMKSSYSRLLRNFRLKDGRYTYEYKY